MAGIRYTVEQLERLRESPLVKKPDELPSIEQWMDVPSDQNNNNASNATGRRPRTNLRDSDAAATGDRTDRPLLNPMGQFGRRPSMQPGEETVLGPPKFNFASATRGAKTGQPKESTAITSADGEHIGDRLPRSDRGERWRDRDTDRTRDKAYPNGRRAGREDGEGWTNVKGRKSLGQEDFDRGFGRNGDRKDGDLDTGDTPRRVGNTRWPRRDENTKEGESTRPGGAGQGGWRDRERNRERDNKDREWNRGAKEEDPEWMDAPVAKKEPKAHTQEDFQRWKEQMRAKDTPVEERDEPRTEQGITDRMLPTSITNEPPVKTALTPSALEPNLTNLFGNWGKDKAAEMTLAEPVAQKPKPDKKSRFMNMFAKPEEQATPMQQQQATPASPAPVPERNADQEGFQRILQMLGGANIGGPQSGPTNGARQGGISLDFQHQSPPPESQEPRAPTHQVQRTLEQQAMLENILRPGASAQENRPSQQARFSSMSPDNLEQFGFPRPNSNRPGEDYAMPQPPRNNNIQDANLSAILNSRARENASSDATKRERDFLLTLMQQPRATPPQQQTQNLPRQPMEHQGLPAFFDQPNPRAQVQPKGRGGLPPGFMEDPRMHEHEMMRREAERRELQMREMQQESMRHKNRGMPAGFPGHDDPAMAGLQRRNTAGEIPRQMTNMGIPSQPVPDLPYMGGGRQPGMPPTPQERPNIAPPPGFSGAMRQPPGLGGPVPQQQQMGPGPSFSAGNTPLGHPPGFAPPGNMRGGFGGPGVPGGNGMQGLPQGYFPPPGYGPPLGMRGEDPRMMFEQQFGGPGPRPQGRPGPPNMY
ncbi:hypothetical protein K458DRAFT_439452 [Lentithecium fluviatile CBS 122367]|uniref:Uncharacterized protein n=1 Tax=Lentithecium fluviatile CBS 122367 TaxID=1168545 RepID=A0A6G1JJ56_9PLEO|nr:hypothetical protein K458DRAFT_439452 [Lentithecium fluviatile CBS 122367]